MSLAHKKPRIAIIGGGPAGLVAAKSLLEESLQPVLFEQSSALGGQWHAPASHSGVWSSMRTNTSKTTTCFSDFPPADHLPMFPTNQQMHAYLLQYAEHFDLHKYVRLNSRVDMVQRAEDGNWLVRSTALGASSKVERFSHVIVASGRFNKPHMPPLTGLETFTGAGGLSHTFDYQDNAPFS
jgi:cation diffusion facilitator CzcD-associated flavoprotein CzcO